MIAAALIIAACFVGAFLGFKAGCWWTEDACARMLADSFSPREIANLQAELKRQMGRR